MKMLMKSLNPFKSGRKFLREGVMTTEDVLTVSIPSNQVGSSYRF